MTEQGADALDAFRQLIESASSQGEAAQPVLLTDTLVGPELGVVLRRCAVPHEFDRALLGLLGGWSKDEAEQHFRDFSELSIMQFAGDSLTVHERWRKPLWAWWLRDEQREEFAALNESLTEWFRPKTPTVSETAQRRQMFHLVGCRQGEGMQMFEELFRRARHRRSFSECSLLIRLVNEYEPVLSASERAVVAYNEGKLASDLRQWEHALELFEGVVEEADIDDETRVFALVREGHVLRALGRTNEALGVLEDAQRRSSSPREAWRALYELGELYRDLGEADRADRALRAALDEAARAGDGADLAGVLNSLGTVQLRLRDTERAIESFLQSLQELERSGDVVRPGAVLNNLGLAQIEQLDWCAAEASFSASLEHKRAAGDQLGQAVALLNLSRAQTAQGKLAPAQESAAQAGALYNAVGDARGEARAFLAQARLAKREGQLEAARSLFERAAERAESAGDPGAAARVREELGRL